MYTFIPIGCQVTAGATDEEKAAWNGRRPLKLIFLIFKK